MLKPFIIGISGGSGSGKTTIVNRILKSPLASQLSVLRHDAYYLTGERMPVDLRSAGNWDHPNALDNELFVAHLDKLLAGHPVNQPVYDFATHSRTNQAEVVEPRPVILVEGILLLAIPEIRQRLALSVFVEAKHEERLARRVVRDIAERGRTLESVVEQFRKTVRPMHDLFVEPSRSLANVIVPWEWGTENEPAIDLILSRIEHWQSRASN